MRISEIILTESYHEDLLVAVQDLLVRIASKEVKEISTEKFKSLLAKQGYVSTTDEVIAAVDRSGFASSVDSDKIVPKGQIPDEMSAEEEPTVDVADVAGDQAVQDVATELPQ
jgi:hypothetical protein